MNRVCLFVPGLAGASVLQCSPKSSLPAYIYHTISLAVLQKHLLELSSLRILRSSSMVENHSQRFDIPLPLIGSS